MHVVLMRLWLVTFDTFARLEVNWKMRLPTLNFCNAFALDKWYSNPSNKISGR